MDHPIIDFHTHLQPSAAEGIAFQQQWGYENPPRTGTPEEFLPLIDRVGVDSALMVPWMPAQDIVDRRVSQRGEDARPEATREVVEEWFGLNQWAVDTVASRPDRLMCLVGLDPLLMSPEALRREVKDKLSKGACGLKIAPMFLRVPPDDERVAIVFDLAAEHGVFVLSQSGAAGYGGQPGWGHPKYFEAVLRAYPSVDVQLAHLGLGAEEEVARLTARHPNLFPDTSSRLHEFGKPGHWSLDEAAEWFRRIGIDRVIFGTNHPMNDLAEYLNVIRAMPLTDAERERILYGNAAGVLERAGAARKG